MMETKEEKREQEVGVGGGGVGGESQNLLFPLGLLSGLEGSS